jgi:two-component system cell cycle sensor histidine kinase/response regulator CckA
MLQQQSLSTSEELAAGIGHDLGNVMAALKLRVEAMALQRHDAAAFEAHVQAIGRMAELGNTLVGKLKATGGSPGALPVSVALDEVVEAAVELVERARPATRSRPRTSIVVRMAGLPRIRARPEELQRVFVNLLLNATDAMPRGGTVTVQGRLTPRAIVVSV